ncbi:hypothetical protein FKW77_001824 [Venturia effusa]|uniref:Heterokaryon incompatibility domain-containing protein n=1 Tax=Venturia effusa TaxID=50376 RepID=A0A517LQP1_9PEZI|nr:hypothetical protein FKW77_001824 [Venturia effusa]
MSYRWGGAEFLKLTSANLKSFQEGRPVSDLPKAFQDVVAVTKSLGIRYLWIDALCILQNNAEDFSHECAEMSRIYSHSACNIIAGVGEDPFTSIFSDRDFTQLELGMIGRTLKLLGLNVVFDAVVFGASIGKDFHDSPLKSRGWILQELLLAPRALYFGKHEVRWVCTSLEASELWPAGYPHKMKLGLRIPSFSYSNTDMSSWHELVRRYSALNLTVAEDKLVAISGLAKNFQRRLDLHHGTTHKYYAGHWSRDFESSLYWRASSGGGEECTGDWKDWKRSAQTFVAPSWSWASTNNEVESVPTTKKVLCQILDIHVTTVGNDPMGRLTGGYLVLKAPTVQLSLLKDEDVEQAMPTTWTEGSRPGRKNFYWDHGKPPYDTVISLVILTAGFLDLGGAFFASISGLILHENDDKTHTRIGAFRRSWFWEVGKGVERANDAVAPFGVGMREWGMPNLDKKAVEFYIADSTKLRTFKIV